MFCPNRRSEYPFLYIRLTEKCYKKEKNFVVMVLENCYNTKNRIEVVRIKGAENDVWYYFCCIIICDI